MPVIALPSGLNVDFGDLSQEDIEATLSSMMSEKPELFQSSSPEAMKKPKDYKDKLMMKFGAM
jgi:NAD(P)H-hydrate repair Nnr-like enzyme with NAD(P)H-hydrate epimerase domain